MSGQNCGSGTSYLTQAQQYYLAYQGCADDCTQDALYLGEQESQAKGLWVTGASRQKLPTFTKRYYQSACRPGLLVADGADITAPADPTFTVNALRRCGGVPQLISGGACEITIYEIAGTCTCLTDICSAEWDYILIYEGGVPNGAQAFTDGTNEASSAPLVDSQTFTANCIYFVSRLSFQQVSDANVPALATAPTVDLLYYGSASCPGGASCSCTSGCSDGTECIAKLNAIRFGAATISFTPNSGSNWYSVTLPQTGTRDYYQIEVVGGQLVALFYDSDGNAGYVSYPILGDKSLGAPNDVELGFTSNAFVSYVSGNKLFVGGADGVIYVVDNLATGAISQVHSGTASDVSTRAIHGCGSTVVATGVEAGASIANAVWYSQNGGNGGWTPASNPPSWGGGVYGSSVYVHSANKWDIGLSNGEVWRTCDGGSTWVLLATLDGIVSDISYPSNRVGFYITTEDFYWTVDGGTTICKDETGVRVTGDGYQAGANVPGVPDGPMIAIPNNSDLDVSVNNVLIGGALSPAAGWCSQGSPVTA